MASSVTKSGRKRDPNKIGQGKPGPGRPKGSQDKITRDVKAMVLAALDKKGGVAYLVEQAEANPRAFLTLVAKCIPAQHHVDAEGDIRIQVVTGIDPKLGEPGAERMN